MNDPVRSGNKDSNYDFANLSHAGFEDLARDLIGQELQIHFEALGAGPDRGIDGRHAVGEKLTILQVKHYDERIAELENETNIYSPPTTASALEEERFEDAALYSFLSSLIDHR